MGSLLAVCPACHTLMVTSPDRRVCQKCYDQQRLVATRRKAKALFAHTPAARPPTRSGKKRSTIAITAGAFVPLNFIKGKALVIYFSWNGNADSFFKRIRWKRVGNCRGPEFQGLYRYDPHTRTGQRGDRP